MDSFEGVLVPQVPFASILTLVLDVAHQTPVLSSDTALLRESTVEEGKDKIEDS